MAKQTSSRIQNGDLTHAWTVASAYLPQGWNLTALLADQTVMASRVFTQLIGTERTAWYAIAEDGKGGAEFGGGSFPSQALRALAYKLERKRGDPNGKRQAAPGDKAPVIERG